LRNRENDFSPGRTVIKTESWAKLTLSREEWKDKTRCFATGG